MKPRIPFGRWLSAGIFVLAVGVLFAGFCVFQFSRSAGRGAQLSGFTIAEGEGVKTIGTRLQQDGLLRSAYWFEVWVWLTGTEKQFLAGDYQLPGNANIMSLTTLLTGGIHPNEEVTVTVIEGWTLRQVAEHVEKLALMSGEDFYEYVTTPERFNGLAGKYSELLDAKPASASLEGYLFPDTYRLFKDSKPEDLVRRMLDRMDKKFGNELREQAKKKGRGIHEVLTVASIVEREVREPEDKAMVADIFWRRLEAGRGLEADSTINYVTGKNTPSVEGKDLGIDSPYNTYRYKGLPPGPISNPGEDSIQAALFPQANNYWYFLTTPTGKVIYSTTFDQHVQAKNKYLY